MLGRRRRRWPNIKPTLTHCIVLTAYVGLMLGRRRRRWPNIKPTLAQRLRFIGFSSILMSQPLLSVPPFISRVKYINKKPVILPQTRTAVINVRLKVTPCDTKYVKNKMIIVICLNPQLCSENCKIVPVLILL